MYSSSYSGLTKKRSFFYRPEYIADQVLWKAIRQGNDIKNDDDKSQGDKTAGEAARQREKLMKEMLDNPKDKTKSPRHKYR